MQHVARPPHLATRTRVGAALTAVALAAVTLLVALAIGGTGPARVPALQPEAPAVSAAAAHDRPAAFGPLGTLSPAQRLELIPGRIRGDR